MSEIKLLPCPRCGQECHLIVDEYLFNAPKRTYVECMAVECQLASAFFGPSEEAAAWWNKRVNTALHSPALTEALETADNIKGLSINESIAVKAIVIALREARGE